MKAIAIDDEPIALDVIKSLAGKVPFIDLQACFTDGFEAITYMQRNNVDLLFLDIKMPDISGIELYNALQKKPLVVFTTAYENFAVTSFELDAVDYLLKPFSLARFLKACNKANELFNYRNASQVTDHMFVKTGYEQVKVKFEDLLYLEATGNYVNFFLKDKKIMSRITLTELLKLLPDNEFIQVHRSYIVSAKNVSSVDRHQVKVGNASLPVGETYSQNIIALLRGN